MNHRNMSWSNWENEFGPLLINPLSDNKTTLFETYGKEFEFVEKRLPANTVWTLMTNDIGDTCISEGMAFINRIAYLISSKPYPDKTTFYIEDT